MSPRLASILLLALTAVLWSANGVVIKSIDAPVFSLASVRAFFTGLTIGFLGRKCLVRGLPGREAWSCGIFLAMLGVSFIAATKLTTAANAIMLQYTSPVWVALLAPRLIGEKTNRSDWIFIAVIFGGMGLFFLDSLSLTGALGVGIAILSGVFIAVVTMIVRHSDASDKVKGVICGNILLFCLLPISWGETSLTGRDIAVLALSGTCFVGLPWYLYTVASRHLTALEMVLITTLEPLCNPLWVYLILGEVPGAWALVGGCIVLTAVVARSALPAASAASARMKYHRNHAD